jgi:lipopolysaccharide transport system ATP-binding protein
MTLGVGLRDELSGRENIYVDGEIQGKTRTEVDLVLNQVIEFSELGKFIDYPVRTYSTGMKARLAFSLITHLEPEILIIDEALSVGDASFSVKATARILEICAKGKIVILVSHGMQSVRDICNRCIYLKDGAIVMDGTPEVVTKAYIDEVLCEDEAALMTRFAAQVGNQSFVAGYGLEVPVIMSGNRQDHSIRIEAAQPLKLRINGSTLMNSKEVKCQVRIVRLDDLILFEQDFPVNAYTRSSGRFGIELVFATFPLAPATYSLGLVLFDARNQMYREYAKTFSIFEVYSLSSPSGGKPMIYYPVSSATVRI